MEILNNPFKVCDICNKEKALGPFRNKWICGRCLLKIEQKVNEERNKFLDVVEQEIKEENGTNTS